MATMEVFNKITRHLDLMGLLVNSTKSMINSCQNSRYDLVEQISENRERLINIIRLLQDDIESELQNNKTVYPQEDMDIFKAWIGDVTELVQENQRLDKECLNLLAKAKESTTKEISTVFKKRQQFQGYNLNNVKNR
ncbi:hypothetical protein M902_1387 [Bacteriovorax sp. BAL6_X]|uniref:hypothetical protein n=1 Tax=Bacteriovorax sp. BAL6_X TaxID=1201290 RepID=UPI0003865F64|nr:hypothetical protein [Bacteriovorax sp. BAL6_X]EPZ50592.1 hypothetical protein M902_1387 [Bacteriovorax sp. BAL6_X]